MSYVGYPETVQAIKQGTFHRPTVIAVKTNGGSVTIEKPVGADWVVANIFDVDGAYPLMTGAGEYRITPQGGAVFQVS